MSQLTDMYCSRAVISRADRHASAMPLPLLPILLTLCELQQHMHTSKPNLPECSSISLQLDDIVVERKLAHGVTLLAEGHKRCRIVDAFAGTVCDLDGVTAAHVIVPPAIQQH